MFKLEDVLQIKDNEEVKQIIRRHVITLVPGLVLAFILIVVPFFLMFPLFTWGIFGVILFMAAVIIGIVVAIRTFLLWDADVFIVTTIRLVDVDQRGILSRIVSEVQMNAIQDVSWSRTGLFQTMLHIGTLRVQTASSQGAIVVPHVSGAEHLTELINDLRHHTAPKKLDLDPERQEKLKRISDLLKGFSVEELTRIEAILKARERTAATEAFLGEDGTPKA